MKTIRDIVAESTKPMAGFAFNTDFIGLERFLGILPGTCALFGLGLGLGLGLGSFQVRVRYLRMMMCVRLCDVRVYGYLLLLVLFCHCGTVP